MFFTESGFRVDLPPESGFRFCDLRSYRSELKKWTISEMDFGYRDEARQELCLVELKDYSLPNAMARAAAMNRTSAEREAASEKLALQIRSNMKDVLVMMHAVWHGHGFGKVLAEELPTPCRTHARVRLYFVMKLPDDPPKELRSLEGPMQAAQSAARGYAKLLGMDVTAAVLDQWRAIEFGLPLSLVT